MTQSIDARTVHVLARAQGHEWMDEETAGRIAVAATAATAAVAAAAPPPGPVLWRRRPRSSSPRWTPWPGASHERRGRTGRLDAR